MLQLLEGQAFPVEMQKDLFHIDSKECRGFFDRLASDPELEALGFGANPY